MWKQWLILVASVAGVAALVWLVAMRAPSVAPPPPPPVARTSPAGGPQRLAETAAERLRVLQVESASLMPDDVRGVFIGLRREELLQLRPAARPERGAPEGYALYQEVLANQSAVAYLVSHRLGRVAQVQFLSRVEDAARLTSHFAALHRRYGDPTAFFDCPASGDTAPTRRIVWRGREVTVMEAVLAHPRGVSLTLAVAGNGEVLSALRSGGCQPVTRERFADWPVATELRGERVPVRP